MIIYFTAYYSAIALGKFVDTKNENKTGSWHVVVADEIAQ